MCVWLCCIFVFFFVFKQKTAYEMRISDWSSDVCSSDLRRHSVSRREPANVLSYALKRLVTVVPTLLVIITVAFFMMRLAPGGPFDSDRALPPEIEKNIKAAYDRSEERRVGKNVSVRVDLGGRRIMKKKTELQMTITN